MPRGEDPGLKRITYQARPGQPSQTVTYSPFRKGTINQISTHTAFADCDKKGEISTRTLLLFQPTQPSQAVTAIIHNSPLPPLHYYIYNIQFPAPKSTDKILLPLLPLIFPHIPGANLPGFSCALMIRTKLTPHHSSNSPNSSSLTSPTYLLSRPLKAP